MFSLIKSAVGLVLLLVAAYAVFFVQVGDQTIASHVSDVWSSQVVQDKVELVRGEVKAEIEERLAKAAEKHTRREVRKHLGEDYDKQDKDDLNDVIGKAIPEPAH